MAEALRPGGWLVAENHDYSSFTAVDRGEPRADRWDRAVATVLSVAEAHGLFVPDLGRRLVGLIREAGLVIVAQEGRTSIRRGGDVVARFAQQSCAYLAGLVDFAGGGAEMELVLAGLDDPTFEFVAATAFGVTARRSDTETSMPGVADPAVATPGPVRSQPVPAIELRAVTKRYGPDTGRTPVHTAVENLTLRVPDGRFVALVGPNGCGKSTLLNLIAGLQRPTEGSISIHGALLGGLNRRATYIVPAGRSPALEDHPRQRDPGAHVSRS